MYKLIPHIKDYIWGGDKLKTKYGKTGKSIIAESWELSCHKDGLTQIGGGKTLSSMLNENIVGENCRKFPFFPVLVKLIDAKNDLSVQVHPSDEYALEHENSFGKTEMWYIVEAEKDAGIYCGFKNDTNKEEFLQKLSDGSVEELLNFIPVKAGDAYFIQAGTVHAIGKGCLICEIQQNSNLTYRVYDYDRRDAKGMPRELHIDKAVKVIDFGKFSLPSFDKEEQTGEFGSIKTLCGCKYFRARELVLNGEFCELNKKSFTAVTFVQGDGYINGQKFGRGDSFFIAAQEQLNIQGVAKAVITDIP